MVYSSENLPCSTVSNNKTIIALENTLHQSISNLKELIQEFEQLQLESDNYKVQILTLKRKCESKVCVGSEALKKVIELKDNIIQSVASALTRLNETKDMSIIDEAFKILYGEPVTLTPPKDSVDMLLKTPKKETSPSYTEPCNDESVSEIEGTPGRTSPIILSRKARNAAASEKKKCPDNWPTPNTKAVKLAFPLFSTPQGKPGKGRLRQTRFTTVKQTSVLDVSSSPESFGLKGAKDTKSMQGTEESLLTHILSIPIGKETPYRRPQGRQLNIKGKSLDDEDMIGPSPTSVTSNFSSIYKSAIRGSPLKLIKDSPNKITKPSPAKLSLNKEPLNRLQIKTENTSQCNMENVENILEHSDFKMEESINLLRPPLRFKTPEKSVNLKDPDETECNIDSSMSVLHRVKKISQDLKKIQDSPSKRPLAENRNFTNLPTQCNGESSITLPYPSREMKINPAIDTIIKKDLERLESKEQRVDTVCKEPTVRKKVEKMALPGWFCDECEHFYAELYKDNPAMLAQKMQECSRHRGRRNPARPRTPPGFWQPRWDVPTDTEEFNRRNNAI